MGRPERAEISLARASSLKPRATIATFKERRMSLPSASAGPSRVVYKSDIAVVVFCNTTLRVSRGSL